MATLHDEMTPTNINTPSAPNEPTPAPLAVAKPQQSITVAPIVQAEPTTVIQTAPPVQDAPPPRAAGGNLVLQGTDGRPAPAVPMQQTQNAPQVLSPISTLKTS